MEPIENVKLEDVLKEVEGKLIEDQTKQVHRILAGIYGDIESWSFKKKQAQKEIERLDGKLNSAVQKIEEVRKGNWKVIELPQQQQPPKEQQEVK